MLPRVMSVLALGLLAALLALSAGACAGDEADDADEAQPMPMPTSTTETTLEAEARTDPPDADAALPSYRSSIATVRSDVTTIRVFAAPGGAPLQLDVRGDGSSQVVELPNPLPSGATTTFLAKRRPDAGDAWIEVALPVRPNGSTGWIAAADVTISETDLAATIVLSNHRLELREAGSLLATYPVAVGTPDTPTPTGTFYVKEVVRPADPGGAYGPLAFGLSAFSPTLVDTEAFADGVIGIHGTDRPDLIGADVSHGCVRLANADVLDLQRHEVPLGMPVTIVA